MLEGGGWLDVAEVIGEVAVVLEPDWVTCGKNELAVVVGVKSLVEEAATVADIKSLVVEA